MLILLSSFVLASPPIVNGQETSDWPEIGMLAACYQGGCAPFCSATLIQESWILTAAHCAEAALYGDMSQLDHYFFVGFFIPSPSIFSACLIDSTIFLNLFGSKLAIWSGPGSLLLNVKCFSIIFEP